MDLPTTQLLLVRFAPGAEFEGAILGAIERLEAGTSLRLVDAWFVRKDADSGELEVIAATDDSAGRLATAVTEFRLETSTRKERSAAAIEANPEIAQLADQLEPGAALGALLLEHRWLGAFADAFDRTRGESVRSEFTNAGSLRELLPQLLEATRR
jgi:hypothetical protein